MADFILKCVNCGRQYNPGISIYLCPCCESTNKPHLPPNGVLSTYYDYPSLRKKYKTNSLFKKLKERGFLDILPLSSLSSLSALKVGNTPLYCHKIASDDCPTHEIYLKDDSQNPTFSYKDRASNLISAIAKENNISHIIAASTGNAGSSLAGIAASQKQKVTIIVPHNAPQAKLVQIAMYGAQIIPVDGSYDDAFDLSIQATKEFGIYNRNTAYNPFTIEGKKTAALEIFAQLNEQLPDRIFVPVGDGCIIAGIYKGFIDLYELQIIDRIPTIIAVQSKFSCNFINNLSRDLFFSEEPASLADSISVKIPRNFYLAKKYLLKYHGESICVSDHDILKAGKNLASDFGIFAEPAAAACYAGYLDYRDKHQITPDSRNVLLLTGSGLKDIKSYKDEIRLPEPILPSLSDLKFVISSQLFRGDQ
jgi:threonine synthase